MNPLKFSLTLLPFLSLVACGPAFEVGNLFPNDAGDAGDTGNVAVEGGRPDVDAGATPPPRRGPRQPSPPGSRQRR